jgi:putative DNA primase/helicase
LTVPGRLLGIHDRDGTVRRWAMPMALMAGSGDDYRRELLHLGLVLGSHRSARAWLAEYLATWRPAAKARCVDRVGWHGTAFVLPDRAYGDTAGERVLLQTAGAAPEFKLAGSLEGWRIEVAAPAAGNSRLVLAISAALADEAEAMLRGEPLP